MSKRTTATSLATTRSAILLGTIWIAVLAASLAWNWRQAGHSMMVLAESEACSSFKKDLVYRHWASLHGGVYVQPSEATPPNPYLAHLPHRDVTTTSGEQLTLINPAYMTRQAHELGRQQYGLLGHITSLNPALSSCHSMRFVLFAGCKNASGRDMRMMFGTGPLRWRFLRPSAVLAEAAGRT